jgi:hypothetical protein
LLAAQDLVFAGGTRARQEATEVARHITKCLRKYGTTVRRERKLKWKLITQKKEGNNNMNEQSASMSWWSRSGSSWVNILLGIWVIISPFVLAIHSPKGVWSNVITGAVVGILALIRWSMHQPGWSWLNLILGIWLFLSPFVLFLSGAAIWNNVILGIIIAALALNNTYSKASAQVQVMRRSPKD